MGKFLYGTGNTATSIEFEDRLLAHLKLVMIAKLRRGESFMFTWDYPDSRGGRSTIWLHPSIPIQFEFLGKREPGVNGAWIDELMKRSHSPGGLQVTPEPE